MRAYTRPAVRLVEVRLLEGPNVYRLEPTVKVELMVGRRRTWYGQRSPGPHGVVVRLGAAVPEREAPMPIRELAAWVRRLHIDAGAAAWLVAEGRAPSLGHARIPVTLHRSSEPGHWVVAWPWRERERAEVIAESALRLVELGVESSVRAGGSRSLARALRAIDSAGATPPGWIRDPERRVPTVSISGTNGKSTTTRMITHILRAAGRHVGTTTSDGVLYDEELVDAGDWTGPAGAHEVFAEPRVEVAVLETARGGMVLKGIGYESNDVSVLTNVSSDHLDLQGIHTLPELAEVKSTVARITRPGGVVVLNAEDPLVAAVARKVRARVCLFALDPRNARVRRQVAGGGAAMVLHDGWLVEIEGTTRHQLLRVTDVPSTIGGLARHNIANALAAAAAARALGVTRAQIAKGLRTFQPTADQAPGRLNLYRRGDRVVVVDFAHNEAGVNVVLDVADGLVGGPAEPTGHRGGAPGQAGHRVGRPGGAFVAIIIGTAGDRPDDTLRGIGRIAAARADEVAIKETLQYLRGRSRESIEGELRAGIAEGGIDPRSVPLYETEALAVRGELTDPDRAAASDRPGVLILMCHAERSEVRGVLVELGFTPVEDGVVPALT